MKNNVFYFVVLDLWRPFLKQYTLLHPELMADPSYLQGMCVPSLTRKRERPDDEEHIGTEITTTDELPRCSLCIQSVLSLL